MRTSKKSFMQVSQNFVVWVLSKAIYLEENQFCEIPMKIIDDDDSELEGNKDWLYVHALLIISLYIFIIILVRK